MRNYRSLFIGACLLCLSFVTTSAQAPAIQRIATDLQNPRGIAVLPDGSLLVAQTGTGVTSDDPADYTGKLSLLTDSNGDGDFEDSGEVTDVIDHLPGYNILTQFNPGRDEVVGIADVLVLDDGTIYFTLDDYFETLSVVEVSPDFEVRGNLVERASTLNSIVFDPDRDVLYIAESSSNALSVATRSGEAEFVTAFDLLAHNQQAVPSGLALDPTTGDVLVALFSGQLWDYYDSTLSFMPGDAKIVRVNPVTGDVTDEIVNLTTAVDVAVDEYGNVFVVELTTEWATPLLTYDFDLYSPDSPPDPGGYARFTGRVTMFPADNGTAIVLADTLDTPTNITYHDGLLYVSTGMGTPGRAIWGRSGRTTIIGEIYTITVPDYS